MTYHNLHPTRTGAPTAHDDGARYTESGMRVPAAEVRAQEVAEQAQRWLAFATERTRMRPHTLLAKALSSVAFSVHHGAASLAVPSKLAGVSEHQRALWALVRDPAEPWAALGTEPTPSGLLVCHNGEPLGLVQAKHVSWVRPLLACGLTLHLNRVTGHAYDGYTLGVNVAFGHVGTALATLLDVLGRSGDGAGDGAPGGLVPAADAPPVSEVSAGDGAQQGAAQAPVEAGASPLRLVVLPEAEAAHAHPLDIVLWRELDHTARASVPHVVRHSPTGIDWGRLGAGPSDLALSVLAHVDADAVDLAPAFAREVVARLPYAGGVVRHRDVAAWVAEQRAAAGERA